MLEFIEAGCEFDEPVAERKFKRGTRPPRKKRVKTAASETAATPEATPEAADAPTGDNPNTDDGGATRNNRLTTVPMPTRVEDVSCRPMAAFLATDRSSELSPAVH